jgi:hypothetical protein
LEHEIQLKEITTEQLAIEGSDDWFWSERFKVYQKVNKEVYVYVSRLLFGWQAQCYLRGNVTMCTLEARTSDTSDVGFKKMIATGEEWLEKYGENVEEMRDDFFHIDGEAWNNGKKEFWI